MSTLSKNGKRLGRPPGPGPNAHPAEALIFTGPWPPVVPLRFTREDILGRKDAPPGFSRVLTHMKPGHA